MLLRNRKKTFSQSLLLTMIQIYSIAPGRISPIALEISILKILRQTINAVVLWNLLKLPQTFRAVHVLIAQSKEQTAHVIRGPFQ